MGYGIGRVPRDVDPISEAMAELEATEIMAAQATEREQYELQDWRCTENIESSPGKYRQCPERTVNLTIYRSGTPGCAVTCERHWLEYHRARLRRPQATIEEIIAHYAEVAKRVYPCARCGKQQAKWNSGAGEALCPRHWDSY